MELIYRSTRNANETATASQAILKGLANEGGSLYQILYQHLMCLWKILQR